jgi:hypothetical protein
VARDLTRRARPIRALDGVDTEGQVAATMDDAGLDNALEEIGPGVILRGRSCAV